MRTQAPTAERLRLASIEITQRCDRRCEYCGQAKADRDMPLPQFSALLGELADRGVEAVALGGGEPTLHPELVALLRAARDVGVLAGLTTNARDPGMVRHLSDAGLLRSYGVSAGKGDWLGLVGHPKATVNLLLLRGGREQVLGFAVQAIRRGARRLLLLGYKGDRPDLTPSRSELSDTYASLAMLGRATGITVGTDDYTRRRLGLAETCGEGFVRILIDGAREPCCFPSCEFRAKPTGPMPQSGKCQGREVLKAAWQYASIRVFRFRRQEEALTMGRVRENIEINGRECWTLFDTGSRNTYVTGEVAKSLVKAQLKRPKHSAIGGAVRQIEESAILEAMVEGHSIETQAYVVEEIGRDQDGKPIEVLLGALAMRQWRIRPLPDEERLDMSRDADEFVEF
jgi:hypothetical protein